MKNITECQQCGVCCTKGGPALHTEDLELVTSGKIPKTHLITIRKGELVYKPHVSMPIPASCELVKIRGTGNDWQCIYFDGDDNNCTIYSTRPIACRKLQCWNTEQIEDIVEKDTISRFDIISENEAIYPFLAEHDKHCVCPDLIKLRKAYEANALSDLAELEAKINDDIRYRTAAIQRLNISLAEELFYFGRPLFQSLQQIGVAVSEKGGRLYLSWPG